MAGEKKYFSEYNGKDELVLILIRVFKSCSDIYEEAVFFQNFQKDSALCFLPFFGGNGLCADEYSGRFP